MQNNLSAIVVSPQVVKQTVMTSVYGVTYIGARDQILARLKVRYDYTAGGGLECLYLLGHHLTLHTSPPRQPVSLVLQERFEDGYEGLGIEELDEKLRICASYLARTTLESLGDLFSSADAIKRWLAEVARLVALAEQPVSWITPLGLPVVQARRISWIPHSLGPPLLSTIACSLTAVSTS